MEYLVYILECSDGTLYTGVTTHVERRVEEHNTSEKGAKYTRVRRPVKLVYSKVFPDRSTAQKEEWRIKKMTKSQKEKLL